MTQKENRRRLNRPAATTCLGAAVVLGLSACSTTPTPAGKDTVGGALIGSGLGAAAGAVAGNNVTGISKTEGAVAGAIVGGLLGGVMGNQRDAVKQQNASVDLRMNSMEQQMNTTVVNITNSNGSTTPVVLHRSGALWIGPRGESYSNLPTIDQLKPVYGF